MKKLKIHYMKVTKQSLRIMIVALLAIMVSQVSAQSLYKAQSYIKDGKYLEGAKELRPLADGGNSEAQYLAALLFMEGKGVNKSEEQAIKYATMAAKQGHEKAVYYLARFYEMNGRQSEEFNLLNNYYNDFKSRAENCEASAMLGACYYYGRGVEVDKLKGVTLMKESSFLDSWDEKRIEAFTSRYLRDWNRIKATENMNTQSINSSLPKPTNSATVYFNNVTTKVVRIMKADENDFEIVKVRHEADKTVITGRFTNRHNAPYIYMPWSYVLVKGKRYYVSGSSLGQRRYTKPNEVVVYEVYYPRFPDDARSYSQVDDRGNITRTHYFK
jgi:hypothetical protein